MALVRSTPHLQQHLEISPQDCPGGTVAVVLANYFQANTQLKSYLLDDTGAVRKHVVLFVDGQPLCDRARQSDAVGSTTEIYVMQSLSGG